MNIIYFWIFIYAVAGGTRSLTSIKGLNNTGSAVESSRQLIFSSRSEPTEIKNLNRNRIPRRSRKATLDCGADDSDFVGSNLFDPHIEKCFLPNDIALLTVRRDFELLLPKEFNLLSISDQTIGNIMLYFFICHKNIIQMDDYVIRQICQRAFYDALGGYLQFYLIPATKQGFYRGRVSLEAVENILLLHQQCKTTLNSFGMGWKSRSSFQYLKHMEIKSLLIYPQRNQPSCCTDLVLLKCNDAENDRVIVSMPKLEPEDKHGQLANVWFPIKRKHIFNLRDPQSAYVLVKFYRKVTGCYEFQGMCQSAFDLKFMNWISENIEWHLNDEQFYPGFGAILSVKEYLRRRSKKDVKAVENSRLKKFSTPLKDYSDKRACGDHKKKKKNRKFGTCRTNATKPRPQSFKIIISKPSKKTGNKSSSGGSCDGSSDGSSDGGCGDHKKKTKNRKFGKCRTNATKPRPQSFKIIISKPSKAKGNKSSSSGSSDGSCNGTSDGSSDGASRDGSKEPKPTADQSSSGGSADGDGGSSVCMLYLIYGFQMIVIIMTLLCLLVYFLRKYKINFKFLKAKEESG